MTWPSVVRCRATTGFGARRERCAKLRGHGRWFGTTWHRFVPVWSGRRTW